MRAHAKRFFLSQNMHSIDHFMRTLDVFIVVDVVYVTWKQRLFILLPNKKRYLQSNQNSTLWTARMVFFCTSGIVGVGTRVKYCLRLSNEYLNMFWWKLCVRHFNRPGERSLVVEMHWMNFVNEYDAIYYVQFGMMWFKELRFFLYWGSWRMLIFF